MGRGAMQTAWLAWRAAERDIVRMVARIEKAIPVVQCASGCFHLFLRVAGPCFVCLALSLMGFGVYVYFDILCPILLQKMRYGGAMVCIATFVGVIILFNVLYNYAKAICVDPGRPPTYEKVLEDHASMIESGSAARPRPCRRCELSKPHRAHHCSVCKRCVLKMDHHCPWINNCVGFGNYRYFMLFMIWMWVLCVYGMLLFWPFLTDALGPRHFTSYRNGCMQSCRKYITFVFTLAACIAAVLCMMAGFHLYLVLTNQTTIEFQSNLLEKREARRNGAVFVAPWNLGRRKNFQEVFGPSNILLGRWLFSWWAPGPAGDGLTFPLNPRLPCGSA
mmetsp:Transcript_21636/g.49271  ORF Transcript_21636/g.49271 Transcript_21636/m.49271 type:complete len:334 (-) Transcript_21636:62-1063(-)